MAHLQAPGLGQTPINRAPPGAVAAGPPASVTGQVSRPKPAPNDPPLAKSSEKPAVELLHGAPLGDALLVAQFQEQLRDMILLMRKEGKTEAEITKHLRGTGYGDDVVLAAFALANKDPSSESSIPWMWIGIGVLGVAAIGGGVWWYKSRGQAE